MDKIELYDLQISLEQLTELIHKSYRQLADLGFRYWGTHQSVDDTKARISKGECYVISKDNKVVGTVVLNNRRSQSFHPLYGPDTVTSFHQFAVDPDYQKQGIGSALISFIEKRATTLGAEVLLCDTAEGATHLVDMYRKRGYDIVEKVDWEGTNYLSVIMSKRLV